jgi:Phosphotransferase enzyme family
VVTSAVRRPPPFPVDRDLPGAAELFAAAGVDRVARCLDERGLTPHRVEPAQAHYRPGRWLAVCFRTGAVERSSGRPLTPTVTVECRAGAPDALWAFPDDPALSGLPAAADGDRVRRRLRPAPAVLEVEPLRYRPRRRAVLRYRIPEAGPTARGRVLFGKVVTPARGRRLLDLADALRSSGLRLALPAGRIAPGALLLPCLPGRTLRDLLLTGQPVPAPDRVVGLTEELHRRASPLLASGRVGDRTAQRLRIDPGTALCAAQVVARLLPEQGCAAGRVAEAVNGWVEESEPSEEWVVHGDLYENQVLVDGDTLGLIDLDDLGRGDPLLDAANFSAHLLALGASGPPRAGAILRYREELRAAFCRRLDVDPAAMAWREAYCLLRLAAGPFRVLHPDWPRRMADRLALATDALSARR